MTRRICRAYNSRGESCNVSHWFAEGHTNARNQERSRHSPWPRAEQQPGTKHARFSENRFETFSPSLSFDLDARERIQNWTFTQGWDHCARFRGNENRRGIVRYVRSSTLSKGYSAGRTKRRGSSRFDQRTGRPAGRICVAQK